MNIYKITFLLVSLGLSGNALSGTIDSTKITTFTSGSVISSSEVNTAVNEVVTQINDNDTNLTALEARIAALESPGTLGLSDMVGSYVATIYESTLAKETSNVFYSGMRGLQYTITLNSDSSCSIVENTYSDYGYESNSGVLTSTKDTYNKSSITGCAFTINNNVLSLSSNGEPKFDVNMMKGGRMGMNLYNQAIDSSYLQGVTADGVRDGYSNTLVFIIKQ